MSSQSHPITSWAEFYGGTFAEARVGEHVEVSRLDSIETYLGDSLPLPSGGAISVHEIFA